MYYFFRTKQKNLDIYKGNLPLNEYNKMSKSNLENIENLLVLDFFEVPSYTKKLVWGEEIIFYPFTDKLFKIVKTTKNDTSIQLHPRKSEIWYPLSNSIVYNGYKWNNVFKGKCINIPKNAIHCMKKDSIVFEVQDNTMFDDFETIRLFDINGREINNNQECFNYILPHNFNHIKVENIPKMQNLNSDFFIFIIDGENKVGDIILKKNRLYYIKKHCRNLFINGNVIYIVSNFIGVKSAKSPY